MHDAGGRTRASSVAADLRT